MKPPFDIAADLETPVSAYRKLAPFRPVFLLESVEGADRIGRYSFIGLDPAMTVRLDGRGLTISGEVKAVPGGRAEVLAALRGAIASAPALLPGVTGLPFAGGLVGAIGYDAVRRFEKLGPPPSGLPGSRHETAPEALLVAPRSLLVFDHFTRRVAVLHAGAEWERASLRREIIAALRGPLPASAVRSGHEPPIPSMTASEYIERVGRVKQHIIAGDVFQLVLAVKFGGACHTDPFEVYRALRLLNPSPYMYFLDIEGTRIVGSSPEALVRLRAGRASLRPIAGTRPRGQDDASDNALEKELLADPKEAAEHVMLVDLARNDLGRVAKPGSIAVAPYRAIERYSHVMHIVSGVQGELEAGKDALDLFAAAFPAGTLVGAPKIRAMQIIDELEPVARGFYGGTVGYLGKPDASRGATPESGAVGDMDQAIAIRTIVMQDGRYSYQAGAGIVADSDAAAEHREVLAKVGALEAALSLAEEGL